jgi:phosphoglycerate dehydrogenase-like enzyme
MKIVLGYVEGDFYKELAREFPEHEFVPAPSVGEQLEEVSDAEVFYGWPGRDVFLAAKNLKWIQCGGTGVDAVVATPEVAESDVVLTNMIGPHTAPIADHTMGMIITLAHRLREMWEAQGRHEWDIPHWHESLSELEDSTLGLVGAGGIGQAVARRAKGFGMKVLAVDPRDIDSEYVDEAWPISRIGDLAEASDWLVVTAPFAPGSKHTVGENVFSRMRPHARLIVVSRGGVVEENSLLKALQSGAIAGAALDVFETEPLAKDSPFWDLPNVLISPHVSAETAETFSRRREIFRGNLRRYFDGEPLAYEVDKHAGY